MARVLIAARHADFVNRAKPGGDPESWLAHQIGIHLRGLNFDLVEFREKAPDCARGNAGQIVEMCQAGSSAAIPCGPLH
jgi:hypothetical protein